MQGMLPRRDPDGVGISGGCIGTQSVSPAGLNHQMMVELKWGSGGADVSAGADAAQAECQIGGEAC